MTKSITAASSLDGICQALHEYACEQRPLFGTSGRSGPLPRDLSAGIATPRLPSSGIDHGSGRTQGAARSRRLTTLSIARHRRHWMRASRLSGQMRCGAQAVTDRTPTAQCSLPAAGQRGWLRRSLMPGQELAALGRRPVTSVVEDLQGGKRRARARFSGIVATAYVPGHIRCEKPADRTASADWTTFDTTVQPRTPSPAASSVATWAP
jgi:hypothetical protein